MQRTEQYGTPSTVAGAGPEDALAWIRRRDRWDQRLRDLEAERTLDPRPGERHLRLMPGLASEEPAEGPRDAPRPLDTAAENSQRSARRAM
jgi:hypothetical protein